MIIVSQDKYNILNFDTTTNIGVEEISTLNDKAQITANTLGQSVVLGKYKNEERAKEVLREIINKYSDVEKSKYIDSKDRNYYKLKEATATEPEERLFLGKRFDNYGIFEMPKE